MRVVGKLISGRSVGKIIVIILSFRVSTSKIKNINHRGKETCAMFGLPIQNKNSAINASLTLLFDLFTLKEKDPIRGKINSKKNVFMRNRYYY